MMGIHKMPRIENYWSTDDKLNVPCISGLMSRTRFEKISQYLHLNDRTKSVRKGQPDFDPLYKVRPLLDTVRDSFSAHYKPGQSISIDEAMIKFNGRLEFKQYMKSKPTPWGIKVWCSADPTSGYLLDFSIYTGKSSKPLIGGCLYILSIILFLIHFHLAVHVCVSVSQDCACAFVFCCESLTG